MVTGRSLRKIYKSISKKWDSVSSHHVRLSLVIVWFHCMPFCSRRSGKSFISSRGQEWQWDTGFHRSNGLSYYPEQTLRSIWRRWTVKFHFLPCMGCFLVVFILARNFLLVFHARFTSIRWINQTDCSLCRAMTHHHCHRRLVLRRSFSPFVFFSFVTPSFTTLHTWTFYLSWCRTSTDRCIYKCIHFPHKRHTLVLWRKQRMERLATLTPADIKNGTLNHMLASAGIPNVQEYVKQFHRQTEELVIEELEHPHSDAVITDEQIVPPADIQSWLTGLRPRFDDPVTEHQPVVNPQQLPPPPPPVPKDLSGLLTGLHPGHDHTIDEPVFEQVTQPQPRPPVNISGWLKRLAPINLGLAEKDFTSDPIPDIQNYTTVSGDLGSWLNDWSRSFALQPPPTSLDTWLKGLIPQDIHEPLGKAASPKARLNSYLNAAQEVLSQHGYNVDSGTLPANVQAPVKAGTFGNVKHMYFLVSITLSSLSISHFCLFVRSGEHWTRTTIERSLSKMCRSCCKRWVWAFWANTWPRHCSIWWILIMMEHCNSAISSLWWASSNNWSVQWDLLKPRF